MLRNVLFNHSCRWETCFRQRCFRWTLAPSVVVAVVDRFLPVTSSFTVPHFPLRNVLSMLPEGFTKRLADLAVQKYQQFLRKERGGFCSCARIRSLWKKLYPCLFLISLYEDKTFTKRSFCQKCISCIRQHLAKVQQEVSQHGSQWPQRQVTWCRWRHYLELPEGRIRSRSVKFGFCFTCKSETFHRNTSPFDVIFLYMVDIWYYFIHRGFTPIAVQNFV